MVGVFGWGRGDREVAQGLDGDWSVFGWGTWMALADARGSVGGFVRGVGMGESGALADAWGSVQWGKAGEFFLWRSAGWLFGILS